MRIKPLKKQRMIAMLILNGKIPQLTQVFTTIAKNRRRGSARRNGGRGGEGKGGEGGEGRGGEGAEGRGAEGRGGERRGGEGRGEEVSLRMSTFHDRHLIWLSK